MVDIRQGVRDKTAEKPRKTKKRQAKTRQASTRQAKKSQENAMITPRKAKNSQESKSDKKNKTK